MVAFNFLEESISNQIKTVPVTTSFPGSLFSSSLGRSLFQRPREEEKRDPGNEVVPVSDSSWPEIILSKQNKRQMMKPH